MTGRQFPTLLRQRKFFGAVHEVHWSSAATDRNAIEATPLENFIWQSGAIAAPPRDVALAWRTP